MMIKLTDSQIEILGMPNFAAARTAKVLIGAGLYEGKSKKAEYEQAVFIHWALKLHAIHGDNWKDQGMKIILECIGVKNEL